MIFFCKQQFFGQLLTIKKQGVIKVTSMWCASQYPVFYLMSCLFFVIRNYFNVVFEDVHILVKLDATARKKNLVGDKHQCQNSAWCGRR